MKRPFAQLRVVIERPSGAMRSLDVTINDVEPEIDLEHIIRQNRPLWMKYIEHGWTVNGIYGVEYLPNGRQRLHPLGNLIKTMAQTVGWKNVIR